ncbi:shikimate kinase [Clostridium sp. N3C]|uniref:AAA family ATPase n=1 Tax=Clostridium sp. N3C TaxID=1776758 RepID=UPI00092E010C|nr:AAA family ATPase [Clostridium sp. N3C]SCN24623.1 shikimate kinase [Clostridium sp. N3C]
MNEVLSGEKISKEDFACMLGDESMKTIYLIGGTMGVGKTTVCQQLKLKLDNCVFLDGDWCWDAHPFMVTEESKRMVMGNICFMLNQFINCSAYDNVVFCWVMHEQEIIDTILANIHKTDCEVKVISLICDEESLRKRLEKDIALGLRTLDIINRSVERIPCYNKLQSIKIDTSNKDIDVIVDEIIGL